MRVNLLSHTPHALELLLYTKNTRLQAGTTMVDIMDWPMEKKLEHLNYMLKTIKSSWEFVDYVFEIQDVPRSFTHQLVRTRNGSYAQESQRTVDVRDHTWQNDLDDPFLAKLMDDSVRQIMRRYQEMIDSGAEVQQARDILPTGIHTNIIAKFNLRTLHEMAKVRLCTRTQGVYQDVFKKMKQLVVAVHPWADDFINVACVQDGFCVFPNYKECPVQEHTFRVSDDIKMRIKQVWEETDHVANPVAKNGRTM